MKIRKKTGVVIGAITAAVVLPMAAAWACTSLATLKLTPEAATTGATVTAEGYGFASPKTSAGKPNGGPVEVRFGTSDGPVLAEKVIPSDTRGTVKFSFKAPEGQAGHYTIIATQTYAPGSANAGQTVPGTPARATLALNGAKAQSVAGASGATTLEEQAGGFQRPPSVVINPATGAPAQAAALDQQAPAAQQAAQAQIPTRRAERLPAISPAGSRAKDILAPATRGQSVLGQAGLMLAVAGAVALFAAAMAATAFAPRRARRRG